MHTKTNSNTVTREAQRLTNRKRMNANENWNGNGNENKNDYYDIRVCLQFSWTKPIWIGYILYTGNGNAKVKYGWRLFLFLCSSLLFSTLLFSSFLCLAFEFWCVQNELIFECGKANCFLFQTYWKRKRKIQLFAIACQVPGACLANF